MEYIFSKKEESLFKRYVAIQFSGMYNMITEAKQASELGEMSLQDYFHIQDHYSELKNKYLKTYEKAKKNGSEMAKKIYG